jgi:class 3 adenylate cyclase
VHELPTGTVTFLFSDIQGSTRLLHELGDGYAAVLAQHRSVLRAAFAAHDGVEIGTEGDSFFVAFARASDAVAAATEGQRGLNGGPVRVRMGLHTGEPTLTAEGYVGMVVHRAARIAAVAHGGQVLLSGAVAALVDDRLPDGVTLSDLGRIRLKDLAAPEEVYQVNHPQLQESFPALRSLEATPNNLPQQTTSFIGRESEIAAIEALLAKTRLLTLTGAGGSGKTRLSLHAAADMLDQFSDGAWFVELAALHDPSLVPQVVATVLGLKEEPHKPMDQTVLAHLKTMRLLLLLDNCEHLLSACADIADALIRQCPHVTILASSREALGIAGEQTYRVPSLSLPDRRGTPTPQTLSMYESVQLFIDRALLVRPEFRVTNMNAAALASLCHHIDGIPLAIELAAARGQ